MIHLNIFQLNCVTFEMCNRLAGAILLTPVTNYWWKSFPANLTKQAYYEQLVQDQWTLRIAHYLPWLTYWWNTQKLFPSSSVASFSEDILFEQDRILMPVFDSYQSKYRVSTYLAS